MSFHPLEPSVRHSLRCCEAWPGRFVVLAQMSLSDEEVGGKTLISRCWWIDLMPRDLSLLYS